VLVADTRVAAELRRVEVVDREPVLERKREELPCRRHHAVGHGGRDAVPRDVEEAHVVRRMTQVLEERVALGVAAAEARDVDQRDGCRRHGPILPHRTGGKKGGFRTKRTATSWESRKSLTAQGSLETVVATSMATDRTRPRSVAVFVPGRAGR